MKKYLFGLGAMVVGAGLMFVLMHGEVSAEGEPKKPEPFVCSEYVATVVEVATRSISLGTVHCETKTLDCAVHAGGVSCVKTGLFR